MLLRVGFRATILPVRQPAKLPEKSTGKNSNDEGHNWQWLLMDQAYGIPTHRPFPGRRMNRAVEDDSGNYENRQDNGRGDDCQ